MKIILDAMGGDHAPKEIVAGAVRAVRELDVELVLVGRGAELLRVLEESGLSNLPKGLEIANAEDVVEMDDEPAAVVRKRRDSSMVVGLRMLADGQGDAMISAGSTGALLAAATLIVKRIPGVRRAVLAPSVPTNRGRCLIVDAGATAECTPEFLAQFACMGASCAKKTMGIAEPRVGLLNIGAEPGKGTELQKQAYELLRELDENGLIHFAGNVEARDVPLGAVDVIVADGFSGNVLLKSIEGTAQLLAGKIKGIFYQNTLTKLAALLCRRGIADLKKLCDYREIGGTPLLGLSKPVIKAHGASDALAVFNAIRQARTAVESGLTASIEETAKEQEHAD